MSTSSSPALASRTRAVRHTPADYSAGRAAVAHNARGQLGVDTIVEQLCAWREQCDVSYLLSRRGSWMSWLRSLPGSPGRSTTLPGLEAQPAAAEPSVYQSRYVMWEAASVPHPGHHRAGWNSRPEYAGLQAGY